MAEGAGEAGEGDIERSVGCAGEEIEGGTGEDLCTGVAVSGTSVYVAGYFTNAAIDFGNITLLNAGNRDGFVAKLTDAGSSGSFTWAQQVGGVGFDQVSAVAASGTSVYVAGEFESLVARGIPWIELATEPPTT